MLKTLNGIIGANEETLFLRVSWSSIRVLNYYSIWMTFYFFPTKFKHQRKHHLRAMASTSHMRNHHPPSFSDPLHGHKPDIHNEGRCRILTLCDVWTLSDWHHCSVATASCWSRRSEEQDPNKFRKRQWQRIVFQQYCTDSGHRRWRRAEGMRDNGEEETRMNSCCFFYVARLDSDVPPQKFFCKTNESERCESDLQWGAENLLPPW